MWSLCRIKTTSRDTALLLNFKPRPTCFTQPRPACFTQPRPRLLYVATPSPALRSPALACFTQPLPRLLYTATLPPALCSHSPACFAQPLPLLLYAATPQPALCSHSPACFTQPHPACFTQSHRFRLLSAALTSQLLHCGKEGTLCTFQLTFYSTLAEIPVSELPPEQQHEGV